jgi:cyclopropane-fatty-acyl-phospholipid synthase
LTVVVAGSGGEPLVDVGDGAAGWARGTLVVRDVGAVDELCVALAARGELGLGEAYVRGLWTSPDVTALVMVLVANAERLSLLPRWLRALTGAGTERVNAGGGSDKRNVGFHYDVGNEFYWTFLTDPMRAYTCGLFLRGDADTLAEAQANKVRWLHSWPTARRAPKSVRRGRWRTW